MLAYGKATVCDHVLLGATILLFLSLEDRPGQELLHSNQCDASELLLPHLSLLLLSALGGWGQSPQLWHLAVSDTLYNKGLHTYQFYPHI